MSHPALDAALDETIGRHTPPASPPVPKPTVLAMVARQQLVDVRVSDLTPDPDNPREDVGDVTELANSMAAAGLLQPIIARRDAATGRLVIVAGHRRLAAAQLLAWTTVPVVVRRDMAPDHVLAAMLIENGQRAGLDPIEEARALAKLQAQHDITTHAELARRIGRTQVHVSGRLALLALPAEEQELVRAGEMSVVQATRRGRLNSGRVRQPGSTGHPYLGEDHTLAARVRARCKRLQHKAGGRNSVGRIGCGECWESVIRADEREQLQQHSNQRGACVVCDTPLDPTATA